MTVVVLLLTLVLLAARTVPACVWYGEDLGVGRCRCWWWDRLYRS